MVKNRQSNFEMLRIISMFLIILCHMNGHIDVIGEGFKITYNSYVSVALHIWGGLGVNCFTMISGYFMIDKSFDFKRVLKIAVQTWIYSILLMIVGTCFIKQSFNLNDVLISFLPILFGEYWYVTAFVGMAMVSPFLNILIKKLGKTNWKKMIIVVGIMLSVIPNLIPHLTYYNDTLWLIYIYILIGGMKYYECMGLSKSKALLIFIISFMFILISTLITLALANDHPILYQGLGYFSTRCVFVMLICSVSLFEFFRQIKFSNTFVNRIASTAFGVYLLHENPWINKYIWNSIFHLSEFFNKWYFGIYCILIGLIAFLMCAAIEVVMNVIIQKTVFDNKLYLNLCNRINLWFQKESASDK